MTRSTSPRRALAAIGALGLAVASFMAVAPMTGGVAQARESSTDQAPPMWGTLLFLSVTKGNQTLGTAILTCDPPGGMHPQPAAACADLNASGGDFLDLPGVPGACDDMWDPVQATAFGWWRSPSLRVFSNTYGNICSLYRSTGWVFPVPGTFPPPSTTTTAAPTPTATHTLPPGPTSTGPSTTRTWPGPTVTWPLPDPVPTVTIDPPDTTIPN
jgi:hypothetical protein